MCGFVVIFHITKTRNMCITNFKCVLLLLLNSSLKVAYYSSSTQLVEITFCIFITVSLMQEIFKIIII